MNDNEIIIFTDGSSKGNPGPGGWAAIIKADKTFEIGGRDRHTTTNNRMELTAAIKALLELGIRNYELGKGKIVVHSDSKYLIDGITKWIHNWQKNNWRTKDRKAVLNRDLWEKLYELIAGKEIEWKYVAGHIGHPENERCDEIAQAFAEGKTPKLL